MCYINKRNFAVPWTCQLTDHYHKHLIMTTLKQAMLNTEPTSSFSQRGKINCLVASHEWRTITLQQTLPFDRNTQRNTAVNQRQMTDSLRDINHYSDRNFLMHVQLLNQLILRIAGSVNARTTGSKTVSLQYWLIHYKHIKFRMGNLVCGKKKKSLKIHIHSKTWNGKLQKGPWNSAVIQQ